MTEHEQAVLDAMARVPRWKLEFQADGEDYHSDPDMQAPCAAELRRRRAEENNNGGIKGPR